MEITLKHFPLYLLMKCGWAHNRIPGTLYGAIDFDKNIIIGSNDNKYHNRIECSLYIPKKFALGYICQYTVKAKINEQNRITHVLYDKEYLKENGYVVVDNLPYWQEKSIELIEKVNMLLDEIGNDNFPKDYRELEFLNRKYNKS